MNEDETKFAAQAQRCRRIASHMTDDEIRQSLEELALEYEHRLQGNSGGEFMFARKPSPGRRPSLQAAGPSERESPAGAGERVGRA